jgi:hypothetical protein
LKQPSISLVIKEIQTPLNALAHHENGWNEKDEKYQNAGGMSAKWHFHILLVTVYPDIMSLENCLVIQIPFLFYLPKILDVESFLMSSCSTEPNWGQLEMQKGQTIEDRHAESWGQLCWALGWRCTTALLLLFSNNSCVTLLLFSYSLKPCF